MIVEAQGIRPARNVEVRVELGSGERAGDTVATRHEDHDLPLDRERRDPGLEFPGYGRRGGLELNALRERLRQACDELDHEFWPDDISLRDDSLVDFARVHGHQQITDVYLLSLAVKHRGCLATIDREVALSAVVGAQPRHLKVL